MADEPLYTFEKLIHVSSRAVPDGVFIVSDTSGHAVYFDRREANCETDLREFLNKQADAKVISHSDVAHWALWISDTGTKTTSDNQSFQKPRSGRSPSVYSWQGYGFEAF